MHIMASRLKDIPRKATTMDTPIPASDPPRNVRHVCNPRNATSHGTAYAPPAPAFGKTASQTKSKYNKRVASAVVCLHLSHTKAVVSMSPTACHAPFSFKTLQSLYFLILKEKRRLTFSLLTCSTPERRFPSEPRQFRDSFDYPLSDPESSRSMRLPTPRLWHR